MAKYRILTCTRVGCDDFQIFKIWHRHTSQFGQCMSTLIFQRPGENVDSIIGYATQHAISFDVITASEFCNTLTLNALRDLIKRVPADLVVHCDSDEFLAGASSALSKDFDDASRGIGVIMNMIDRVNHSGHLYSIDGCESYQDLCEVAPLRGNLTSQIQKWSTTKLVIQPWPLLDGLHGTRTLMARRSDCYLDHFKWRTEWRKKALRRLQETINQNKEWSEGIAKTLKHLGALDAK